MAEFEWRGKPQRASLRHALRHRLRLDSPDLRVIAENFLTEVNPVDLLAVGSAGELVSIRLAVGSEDEGGLLTRSLIDLTWLRQHAGDLAGLAPEQGLSPSSPPRALLFLPNPTRGLSLALEHFPPGTIELHLYLCLRQQGQLALWTQRFQPDADPAPPDPRSPEAEIGDLNPQSETATGVAPTIGALARGRLAPPSPLAPEAPTPSSAPRISPSGFRTGLTEAALRPPRPRSAAPTIPNATESESQ